MKTSPKPFVTAMFEMTNTKTGKIHKFCLFRNKNKYNESKLSEQLQTMLNKLGFYKREEMFVSSDLSLIDRKKKVIKVIELNFKQ